MRLHERYTRGCVLTVARAVIVTEGAVLVTISGERPSVEYLRSLRTRYAALDGRILDNLDDDSKDIQHIYPWLSQSWSSLFDSVRVRAPAPLLHTATHCRHRRRLIKRRARR